MGLLNRITDFRRRANITNRKQDQDIKQDKVQKSKTVTSGDATRFIKKLGSEVQKDMLVKFNQDARTAEVLLPKPYEGFLVKATSIEDEDRIIEGIGWSKGTENIESFRAMVKDATVMDFTRNWDLVVYSDGRKYDFKKSADNDAIIGVGSNPEGKIDFLHNLFDKSISINFLESRLFLESLSCQRSALSVADNAYVDIGVIAKGSENRDEKTKIYKLQDDSFLVDVKSDSDFFDPNEDISALDKRIESADAGGDFGRGVLRSNMQFLVTKDHINVLGFYHEIIQK